jgi:hypothetical protein
VDSKTVITVITIAISIISLAVSGTLALRQMRTATDGYALPVVLNVFSQFRTQEFFDAQQYVFHQLNREFEEPTAYTELPLEARSQVRAVAGLYDDLGKLVAHGIVREELVIGSNGTQARRIWEAVEPFVLEERRKRKSNLWIYLEDLAYRSTRTPPASIYAKLKLHRYEKPEPRDRGAGRDDEPGPGIDTLRDP